MAQTRRRLIAATAWGVAGLGRHAARAQSSDRRACLFGDLAPADAAPADAAPARTGPAGWSGVRQAGEDGTARIVYRIAAPRNGASGDGPQAIEFGVLNLSDAPVQVHFVVVVTSNIGRWYRYHFAVPRVAALGETSGGAALSKAPFPPGECIAEVTVGEIRSLPAGP